MELAARAPQATQHVSSPSELRSWLAPECQIGLRTFQGASDIVEVIEVTYQQKAHTYGQFGKVTGITINGDGFVGGGGGFVDTIHTGVATAVVRDCRGAEEAFELPADVAARARTILRIDSIDGRMIAVTNISGQRDIHRLASSVDFIPQVKFTPLDTILAAVCAVTCAFNLLPLLTVPIGVGWLLALGNCLIFLVAFGIVPILKFRAIRRTTRERSEFIEYMNSVTE